MAIPACCSSVDLTSAIGPMVQLDYDELIPLSVHISAVLLQEELEIRLIFFFLFLHTALHWCHVKLLLFTAVAHTTCTDDDRYV